jgi:type IV pilus modification protein PilV
MTRRAGSVPKAGETGFSLIEIMVAMTFLGIGLLVIAQLIPLGMAGVTEARNRTSAVQTAQRVMDQLRVEDYGSAALTAGTYTQTDGRYAIGWTITDDTPIPRMKRVDLFATWNGGASVDTVALSTYITPGL